MDPHQEDLAAEQRKHPIPMMEVIRDDNNSATGDEIAVTFQAESKVDRGTWSGKLDFMMACIGYAVGLGNVWRFPYLCFKNGGGAFLIPYCIMVGIIGLPLFFLEFAFGQFASLGPISIWSISPMFKGIGYTMVFVSWILSVYYNVIVARCLFFFGASFQWELPWARCNNWWNDQAISNSTCVESARNVTNATTTLGLETTAGNISQLGDMASRVLKTSTPAEDYYYNYVLEYTGSIDNFGVPSWKLLLSLLGCWIIVCITLSKGVQSLGKISYFTAIFPYLVLISLLIKSCTLEGAVDGLYYYLKPEWEKLLTINVWTEAATQIFFSLSVCSGGLITMSSFNKFKNNCYHDSVIIVIINCLTSVFAGLVVFSNLGHMAHIKNVTIDKVVKSGSGLVFTVYPEALMQMPGSVIWSIVFFLMMVTLGMGSQFSIMESVLSGLQDELRQRKILRTPLSLTLFRVGMCVLNFALGIPLICGGGSDLLDLIDGLLSSYPLLFIALCELVVVSYCYGLRQFKRDVSLMIESKPNIYWRACWLVITPLTILTLIVCSIKAKLFDKQKGKIFPYSWRIFENTLGLVFVMITPVYFLYKYCKEGGYMVLKENLKPVVRWGPANEDHRDEFINQILRSNDSIKQNSKLNLSMMHSVINLGSSVPALHNSIIAPNGGLVGPTSVDEFYSSKLNLAGKFINKYSKEMSKTNPDLAALIFNSNSAADAAAEANKINEAAANYGNSRSCNSSSFALSAPNNNEQVVGESPDANGLLGSTRPSFQLGPGSASPRESTANISSTATVKSPLLDPSSISKNKNAGSSDS